MKEQFQRLMPAILASVIVTVADVVTHYFGNDELVAAVTKLILKAVSPDSCNLIAN